MPTSIVDGQMDYLQKVLDIILKHRVTHPDMSHLLHSIPPRTVIHFYNIHTRQLYERWTIGYDKDGESGSVHGFTLLVQSLYSRIRWLPLHGWLGTRVDRGDVGCKLGECESGFVAASRRFQLQAEGRIGRLSVEVEYDPLEVAVIVRPGTPRPDTKVHRKKHSDDIPTSSSGSFVGSFIGSYESSLLMGRMSTVPSRPIEFIAQIGVLASGTYKPKCPPHVTIPFNAYFYQLENVGVGTPYVGTVDLEDATRKGYRVPAVGQVQMVIKNPHRTAVKLFLVPYDLSDMPARSKTFLQQKSYVNTKGLHSAIHLSFVCDDKRRVYANKTIRVVFAHKSALDGNERLKTVTDGPNDPKYTFL